MLCISISPSTWVPSRVTPVLPRYMRSLLLFNRNSQQRSVPCWQQELRWQWSRQRHKLCAIGWHIDLCRYGCLRLNCCLLVLRSEAPTIIFGGALGDATCFGSKILLLGNFIISHNFHQLCHFTTTNQVYYVDR